MYHYLYKVTNTSNQKYYIGVHSTTDLNDGYLGSGVAIKEAILKFLGNLLCGRIKTLDNAYLFELLGVFMHYVLKCKK